MDEEEYDDFMERVFGASPIVDDERTMLRQLFDEDGAVEGCYRVMPAPTE